MTPETDHPPTLDITDVERGIHGSSDPLSPSFGGGVCTSPFQTSTGAGYLTPGGTLVSPAVVSQAGISALNLQGSTPILSASPPPPFDSAKASPTADLPSLSYEPTLVSQSIPELVRQVSLGPVEKAPSEKVIIGSAAPAPPKPTPGAGGPKSKPPQVEASLWIRFNLFFNTYR